MEHLLSPDVVSDGFYFRDKRSATSPGIWDQMASENPLQAAIAVTTEQREAEKTQREIEVLKSLMNKGVVLDVGCGYGRTAKYLLPSTEKVGGYIGIDSSQKMLELFFESGLGDKVPLLLIKSTIDEIKLQDNSVDNVVTSAVLLHNHRDIVAKAVREMHRVLKPGGKLFAFSSLPNRRSLRGLQGQAYLHLLRWMGQEYRNGPVRYFSEREVSVLFEGFSSIRITRVGFEILPKGILVFPASVNKLYRTLVYRPTQTVFSRLIPRRQQSRFCTSFDVFARK